MRDIRDDLRERLAGLRAERDSIQAQLHAKMDEITEYEQRLVALLELEESRSAVVGLGTQSQPLLTTTEFLNGTFVSPKERFESVILVALEGGGVMEHAKIKEFLEKSGLGHGDASFGRALHGTLMSMRSRKLVDLVGKGTWRRHIAARANAS